MALECRIVSNFAELEAISGEWDMLAASSGARGAVFQMWAWARACWASRSETLKLHAPMVTESGRTLGIMPLVIEGRTLKWLTAPFADYNDILINRERAAEVLAACYEELLRSPAWTDCVLENVADTSTLLCASNQAPAAIRKKITTMPRFRYSAVQENRSGVLDHMSRKRSFRQHENRLARQGKVQFRHIENHDEIMVHLDNFFAMHVARSALAGRESQFTSPQTQQLFRTLATGMDPARVLRFSVLEMDGRPLAYHL
jgi:CelD/BcsL family acetyltransferase involved in cellulose biosynthesis